MLLFHFLMFGSIWKYCICLRCLEMIHANLCLEAYWSCSWCFLLCEIDNVWCMFEALVITCLWEFGFKIESFWCLIFGESWSNMIIFGLIDFRIYFAALAAFARKIISWDRSIGLRRSTSRWKAKKKIYNFYSEVKSGSNWRRCRGFLFLLIVFRVTGLVS